MRNGSLSLGEFPLERTPEALSPATAAKSAALPPITLRRPMPSQKSRDRIEQKQFSVGEFKTAGRASTGVRRSRPRASQPFISLA
jgi:hypothetical protein